MNESVEYKHSKDIPERRKRVKKDKINAIISGPELPRKLKTNAALLGLSTALTPTEGSRKSLRFEIMKKYFRQTVRDNQNAEKCSGFVDEGSCEKTVKAECQIDEVQTSRKCFGQEHKSEVGIKPPQDIVKPSYVPLSEECTIFDEGTNCFQTKTMLSAVENSCRYSEQLMSNVAVEFDNLMSELSSVACDNDSTAFDYANLIDELNSNKVRSNTLTFLSPVCCQQDEESLNSRKIMKSISDMNKLHSYRNFSCNSDSSKSRTALTISLNAGNPSNGVKLDVCGSPDAAEKVKINSNKNIAFASVARGSSKVDMLSDNGVNGNESCSMYSGNELSSLDINFMESDNTVWQISKLWKVSETMEECVGDNKECRKAHDTSCVGSSVSRSCLKTKEDSLNDCLLPCDVPKNRSLFSEFKDNPDVTSCSVADTRNCSKLNVNSSDISVEFSGASCTSSVEESNSKSRLEHKPVEKNETEHGLLKLQLTDVSSNNSQSHSSWSTSISDGFPLHSTYESSDQSFTPLEVTSDTSGRGINIARNEVSDEMHTGLFPKNIRSVCADKSWKFISSKTGKNFVGTKISLSPMEPFLVNLCIEGQNLHLGPFLFEVFLRMTVRMLKLKVFSEFQFKTSVQKWILGNSFADDDESTLQKFGVSPGSHIFLYLDLSQAENLAMIEQFSSGSTKQHGVVTMATFLKSDSESCIKSEKRGKKFTDLPKKEKRSTSLLPCHESLHDNIATKRNMSGDCTDSCRVSDSVETVLPSTDSSHKLGKRLLPKLETLKTQNRYGGKKRSNSLKENLLTLIEVTKSRRGSGAVDGKVQGSNSVCDVGDKESTYCDSDCNSSTGYITVSSNSSTTLEISDDLDLCCSSANTRLNVNHVELYDSYPLDEPISKGDDVDYEDVIQESNKISSNSCCNLKNEVVISDIGCLDGEKITECGENAEEDIENKEATRTYGDLLELENLSLIPNADEFECPVCFTQIFEGEGVVLRDCLHTFCKECLLSTVTYTSEALVKCPYRDAVYSCSSCLQQREIRALISQEAYEQYLQRGLSTAETIAEKSFHCRSPDCPGWCLYEDKVNIFHCPVCLHYNCLTCQTIHEGFNCRQYQDNLKKLAEVDVDAEKTLELLDKMVRDGQAMRCPMCCVILMKKWGCDWLKCSVCQTEVCWITKGPRWGPKGHGDLSAGCKCGVDGKKCHPLCTYCH